MQELYRINIKPYSYDSWDIFTEDKDLFTQFSTFWEVEDAVKFYGEERWEELADGRIYPKFPYVLLGETTVRQYD